MAQTQIQTQTQIKTTQTRCAKIVFALDGVEWKKTFDGRDYIISEYKPCVELLRGAISHAFSFDRIKYDVAEDLDELTESFLSSDSIFVISKFKMIELMNRLFKMFDRDKLQRIVNRKIIITPVAKARTPVEMFYFKHHRDKRLKSDLFDIFVRSRYPCTIVSCPVQNFWEDPMVEEHGYVEISNCTIFKLTKLALVNIKVRNSGYSIRGEVVIDIPEFMKYRYNWPSNISQIIGYV